MKVAIVTDSNSGITQTQAEEMGLSVLPMPFMIDGQTYYEDIDLTQEQFYIKLRDGADISTSQPTPDSVLNLWDRLLEENDQVVHIPMTSGLSGSCQTAMMLAQDYEGKVFVVDNRRISVTQRQSAIDAVRLAKEGKTGEEIKKILEDAAFDTSIYRYVKVFEKRRKNYSCCCSPGDTFKDQTGIIHTPGEKAGCVCKGQNDETGEKHYAYRIEKRSGRNPWRQGLPSFLSPDRPYG